MALSTQPYKGARDFYPEDKRLQKYIFSKWREVVEKFGYEEYDAPLIEPLELYAAKTGEEIVNEQTYNFTDRGGRQVAIRPEMTPTVSRMVAARRQELAYPLRWYSIPNLWRYERPQRGRLREHWQLNADIFGIAGLEAEQEVIELADAIMQAFKAPRETYTIRINSRQLINSVMSDYLRLDDARAKALVKLIDRMNKIDKDAFVAAAVAILTPPQRQVGLIQTISDLLSVKAAADLPGMLKVHPSALELQKLVAKLQRGGISNAVFDISLVRGFDYYTDIVFEVFDTNPENNRSMFGGGRYDGLVGLFGVDPVPTVGFGMGDVTLQNFLEGHKLLPELQTETELYLALIGDVHEACQPLIDSLRKHGVRVAVDFSGRTPDKQIKAADKKGIKHILFIGDKELASEQYVLKNLSTGKEEKHGIDRLISVIKDFRN